MTVDKGGTGATTLASNGILYGNGTSAVGATAAATTPSVLLSTVTTNVPAWTTSTAGNFLQGSVTGAVFAPITNISPGTDFRITQNSVVPFTSVNSGAVANTLYLKAGSVGIGTASPSYNLHVTGSSIFGSVSVSGANQYGLNTTGSSFRLINESSGNTVLTALTNNNAGIGTTAPNEKLEVTGNERIGQAPATLTTVNGAHTSALTTITVASTAGYPTAGTLLINGEAMTYTGTTATTFTGVTRGVLGSTAVALSTAQTVNNYLSTFQATSTTPRMVVMGSGNVGIGTTSPGYALDVTGDINSSGCVRASTGSLGGSCVSDERLKTEIRPFDLGLDSLLGINPKFFKYNGLGGHPASEKPELGVIAQEVEKTAPSLVSKLMVKLNTGDKKMTEISQVNYTSFIYVAINAIKELYHKWHDDSQVLHREITNLKKQNEELQTRLNKIEKLLMKNK